ncbi:MAG: type 2 isopentenyl-diphosphate Delta-isomerase [Tissierellia bacterium]|nr:type 2 isopentenyl-diphosphate Delta-isomerase [Tissierellia bacterium]
MTNRRDLYIENSLISAYKGDNLLKDVYIEHNSLPEISFDDINTFVEIFGKKVAFPLIINAMTGGTEKGCEINEMLYMLSKELNIPMEVGSQMELIKDNDLEQLFIGEKAEGKNRKSVLISNLSSKSSVEDVKYAMDVIDADGIALHLNSGQEAAAKDGNKDFRGIVENIKIMAEEFSDRLIVKEVGFGMSSKTIKTLVDCGVKMIDVSGAGGTNFIEIENLRCYEYDFSDLYCWGIPTAKAIIDARNISKDIKIIASGGIKTALDIVKAIVLGADYVGISGEILKFILHGGYDQAKQYIEELMYKTKIIMFLLGVKNIEELKKVNYTIKGELKDLING